MKLQLKVTFIILHTFCAITRADTVTLTPQLGLNTGRKLIQNQTPFPKWLSDFTGLSAWPDFDPPYIPLNFIDMNKIPDFDSYKQGDCSKVSKSMCSFDCHGCVADGDIQTCRKLSQTFDDGPSQVTEQLLNKLNSKLTFFVLGVNVVSYPDLYEKMMDKGHLIGSHTWSHKYLPSLTNEQIIAQIEWSIWAMNATGHHTPKWFRPPYGGIDNRVRAITEQFGLQSVLWDYDTFDWSLDGENPVKSERKIYSDIRKLKENRTGIILEHDGTEITAEVAIKIQDIIGNDQLTVAQCVGGNDYLHKYDDTPKH
ncbi:uncharacterized protein KNAG_0I02950 [Huiozyma naganishii CBS 8797]|uniref:chitin deacetylase n=1 Tax=Huiozyma naganishii (strain ATCC MYA-139 / BCRC 22969 / CBS 8797 / KCTC 17520 / NBRC 10181 / NCYC 3082 / Yp74L-3) TaxID=1071383 RepID=J7S9F6_HUIN7|nr:hypothetical protein KNAG_0I02950 [Kazachstania naganishii CBS 8797]CCK72079.1 hypothetical protein KNAG_0I02950 [Kazachstania naganishii CBS 8797]